MKSPANVPPSLRIIVSSAALLAACGPAAPPAEGPASLAAPNATGAPAAPESRCVAGDKPFTAVYAVALPLSRTGGEPSSLSVQIYEAAPKTDKDRKDACDYLSKPPFAAAGRELSLYFEDKTRKGASSDVVLHEGESGPKSNWIADKGKATLQGSGAKLTIELKAAWSGASCEIALPVTVCE
jgi:hypothetical protein